MMIPVHQMTLLDTAVLLGGLCLLLISVRILLWHRAKGTRLRGPSSKSLIFGNSNFLRQQKDSALVYEEWAEQYGDVFCTPIALGKTQVILCDPKAIQHFYSKETYGYVQNAINRFLLSNMVCASVWTCTVGKANLKVHDRLARVYSGQKATAIRGGYWFM